MEQSEYNIKTLNVPTRKLRDGAKTSFERRLLFIELYNQGYAVFNIAKTFHTTSGTVEHHLTVAGVYTKWRKPTKRKVAIQGYEEVLPATRILSPLLEASKPRNALEARILAEDDATEKMQKSFPKNYKEYLRRARERHPIEYNGQYHSTISTFSSTRYFLAEAKDTKVPMNYPDKEEGKYPYADSF